VNEIKTNNGLEAAGAYDRLTGQGGTDPLIAFEGDYHALRGIVGGSAIIEAVLKHPAALVYELTKGRSRSVAVWLVLVAGMCLLAYGVIMGSYKGGIMYLVAPAKLALGVFLSSLLCLPSLYIFSSMGGSRQTLSETAGILLLCQTLAGVLLLGFAPIAWVFSQSTSALAFMGFLHLAVWLLATVFAVRVMSRAFEFLNHRKMGVLNVWAVIFIVVTLQMSTVLRPLIAKPVGPVVEPEKMFFLTHWGKCLSD
jgi:hypothetical protein